MFYTGYRGTNKIEHGLTACTADNSLAKARGYLSVLANKQSSVSHITLYRCHSVDWGWSGGAKVLCKLSVPGRPIYLAYSRARAYCAYSRCGWGIFGHFFSRLSFLFSFSLSGRRPDID